MQWWLWTLQVNICLHIMSEMIIVIFVKDILICMKSNCCIVKAWLWGWRLTYLECGSTLEQLPCTSLSLHSLWVWSSSQIKLENLIRSIVDWKCFLSVNSLYLQCVNSSVQPSPSPWSSDWDTSDRIILQLWSPGENWSSSSDITR